MPSVLIARCEGTIDECLKFTREFCHESRSPITSCLRCTGGSQPVQQFVQVQFQQDTVNFQHQQQGEGAVAQGDVASSDSTRCTPTDEESAKDPHESSQEDESVQGEDFSTGAYQYALPECYHAKENTEATQISVSKCLTTEIAFGEMEGTCGQSHCIRPPAATQWSPRAVCTDSNGRTQGDDAKVSRSSNSPSWHAAFDATKLIECEAELANSREGEAPSEGEAPNSMDWSPSEVSAPISLIQYPSDEQRGALQVPTWYELSSDDGEDAPNTISEISGHDHDPGDLWLKGDCAKAPISEEPVSEGENDIESDTNAIIALGEKGIGLPPKAKRVFWRLKRSKGQIQDIFKDVLIALILQAATGDLLDSQLNDEQRASHLLTVNQACLKMSLYQIAREVCEWSIKHKNAIGGFQERLLTRPYRGDGTR